MVALKFAASSVIKEVSCSSPCLGISVSENLGTVKL